MYIPDCLVEAMGYDGCSAVKIYSEEAIRKEIASRFTELFNEEYEKIMDLIEEEQGDCEEKDEGINPFNSANVTDYGVFLSFECLAMYGDSCQSGTRFLQHPDNALTLSGQRS